MNNLDHRLQIQNKNLSDVRMQSDSNIFSIVEEQIITLKQTRTIQVLVCEIKIVQLNIALLYKRLTKIELTRKKLLFLQKIKIDTWIKLVYRLKGRSHWFILSNQFEELSTISQPNQGDRFLASLLQSIQILLRTNKCFIKIVATMQADFLNRLSLYPRLVKAIVYSGSLPWRNVR